MVAITAALVKELRERTAAGMMECKKALVEANGDIELAIDNMRKSGQAKAAKKAGRIAAEGIILAKVSADGKYGVILELNCETDFVAKDAGFKAFGEEVINAALAEKIADIDVLKAKFEEQRANLVAKIGENITFAVSLYWKATFWVLTCMAHVSVLWLRPRVLMKNWLSTLLCTSLQASLNMLSQTMFLLKLLLASTKSSWTLLSNPASHVRLLRRWLKAVCVSSLAKSL